MDKRYLKNVAVYVISAALSVLLIAYIVYHLVSSFSSDIETLATDLVTVSETYAAEAYIFRDEELLYSEVGGNVNYLCNDGTKIAKSTAVAQIYQNGDSESSQAQLSDLENQIAILEDSNPAKDSAISDSSSVDAQIESLYYTIRNKINDGDLDYVFRRKDELLTLLNKRQMIINPDNDFDDIIEELRNEKSVITSTFGGVSESVYNESSGYFYSEVDGYEEIFSASRVDSFTMDEFYSLIEEQPSAKVASAVAKVATSYEWYIACEIPSVHQQYYFVGSSYDISFPYSGGKILPMELHRIVTDSDSDNVILIFKTGHVPVDFNFLRKQSVEIVQQSYTGYRVPVSAVRMVEQRQGVYIKNGNLVEFREIVPLVEIDGYFIVEEQNKQDDPEFEKKLGMFDLVIVKGKNLYENKIIQ